MGQSHFDWRVAVGAAPGGASVDELQARAAAFRTIPEVAAAARRCLPRELWDYAFGGAETEATLRRNRWALEAITFRPRVLQGHRTIDLSTTFLGLPLALPVMLAPVGSIGFFHPEGALACARAAHGAGTLPWVGTLSTPNLEEVASGAGRPLIFQLYVRGDRDWIAALVRRAEVAGYHAICFTVDSAAYGRRERDLHNRFRPTETGERPNVGTSRGREEFQATLTWEDAAWLRRATELPLIMKGVVSAEDARLAVEHGYDAVYVSNHGGRQQDYLPSTIEVLQEVAEAVGGRAELAVDGGFLRGTDVLKALALGARAVCIGKGMLLGLGAAGEPGLERLLALLAEEMRTSLANLGVGRVTDLTPAHLRLPRFETLVEARAPAWGL